MAALDGHEPVGDGELIYRRIPVSKGWYDPKVSPLPSPKAFEPRKKNGEATGISVVRAKYRTLKDVAIGPSKQGYYVAVLGVTDLRARGIDVVPRPLEGNPGHAEIPNVNSLNCDTDQCKEWQKLLAHELTIRVEGPFVS